MPGGREPPALKIQKNSQSQPKHSLAQPLPSHESFNMKERGGSRGESLSTRLYNTSSYNLVDDKEKEVSTIEAKHEHRRCPHEHQRPVIVKMCCSDGYYVHPLRHLVAEVMVDSIKDTVDGDIGVVRSLSDLLLDVRLDKDAAPVIAEPP